MSCKILNFQDFDVKMLNFQDLEKILKIQDLACKICAVRSHLYNYYFSMPSLC